MSYEDDEEMEPVTITLTAEEWAVVVAALVVASYDRQRTSGWEREQYPRIGRAIAEACPTGSTAWFGAALLDPPT